MSFAFILIASLASVVSHDNDHMDLNLMQGTWTVVVAEREGQQIPENARKTMQVVIKGNVMTITEGKDRPQPRQEKAAVTLNTSTKPKSLDFKPVDRKEEKPCHGIYEFSGGDFKLCWTLNGGERPREFATKPNSNTAMFVLKRDKKSE